MLAQRGFVPQVMGVGYQYVGYALIGSMPLKLMALLVVLKLFSVTISYASGNAGGIFGPALFIGAMLGGVVGTVAHYFFPAHTANLGAYALVGMGTAFAGIVRAPMTSVLMIFEMTQDYAVIVPLMISNLISLFIVSRLQKQPIYEALAIQDGIHLPSAESRQRREQRQVVGIMRAPAGSLSAETTVREALGQIGVNKFRTRLVTDERGLAGVVNCEALELPANVGKKIADLTDRIAFPHVHADHRLEIALERMGANYLDVIPVVSRADVHQLLGVVTLKDVLEAYGIGD